MNYVSYCRVSTKRQGDSGLGLEAQLDIINHYYPVRLKDFVEVKSGTEMSERVILKKAIQYCIDHDAYLVCAKVDRLSRSVEDGLGILRMLNGRLKFCDMPSEVDKFTLTLYFAFAEREAELISLRTKAGLKASGKLKGWKSHKDARPKLNDEARKIAADKKRIAALNNEFNIRAASFVKELITQDYNYSELCDALNNANFLTPRGRKWSVTTVSRLVHKNNLK